jgi:hypothetical protein
MQNNTEQQAAVRGMEVLDHVPEGWKVIPGATAHPHGYRWVNNNKSLFGGEYKQALVPEEVANEWQSDNTR